MAAVSSNTNEKILLYEEVIDDAMDLCAAGSESRALLQALREVRFHGADPAETRAGLICETGLNFKVIARDVVINMKSYGSQCDQNRRNVLSRSKKAADTKSADPNVVGGGMALHEEVLEALIDFANDEGDKDLAQLLDALREIRFGDADPQTVKLGLSRSAKTIFTVSAKRILEDKARYTNRCEQNRINASKRRCKSKAAAPEITVAYTPNAPVQIADGTPQLEVPYQDSPVEMRGADPIEVQQADQKQVNPSNEAGNATVAVSGNQSQTVADDRSGSLTIAGNTNSKDISISKKKNTPLFIPPAENEGGVDYTELRKQFDRLFAEYPKQVDEDTAWKTFVSINPNADIFDQMMAGLEKAKEIDSRFPKLRGSDRYTPLLSTWLQKEQWLYKNMHVVHDTNGNPASLSSLNRNNYNASNSYDQRPPMSVEEKDERKRRTLEILKERYGTN